MLFRTSLMLLGLLAAAAGAETWQSSLLDDTYVLVEKQLLAGTPASEQPDGTSPVEALPPDVVAMLGPDQEDYDAFAVSFLPSSQAAELRGLLARHALAHSTTQARSIHLPWRTFDPTHETTRVDPTFAGQMSASPVPGLYLVQFAYPIRSEWLRLLDQCAVERIGYFQHRTYLVRAANREAIVGCGASRFIGWIDSYYTTDRIASDLLSSEGAVESWLQFQPGTDLGQKTGELRDLAEILEVHTPPEDGFPFLRVRATAEALASVAGSDPDLLSVARAGIGALSDERQGQIVAGNHNGVAVTTTGFKTWLNGRGLLTASNQQTVAVVDLGYDDGQHPGDHHPDLENPDRLVGLDNFFIPKTDTDGHGTMVSGIIAGDGATGTTAKDPQGFYYGTGISPKSKIYLATVGPLENLERQQLAFNAAHSHSARIMNQSWNQRDVGVTTSYTPVNYYDLVAQFFDQRTLDMSTSTSGEQPATIVLSAGNYRQNCNGLNFDTVASPATAKNVIAVGASRSYRPSPEPPLDCRPCTAGNGTQGSTNFGRPPNEDANNVGRVADFSSRGRFFSPYPNASGQYAHSVRIKPDLVAPAVRVFSTVPYDFASYPIDPGNFVGCTDFYPHPNASDHTYGSGTSFAAPVVSGAAALARKWFLDRGTDPSPSLVKAALIATASTLGGSSGAHDHRPSAIYGWGRVNLDTFTDSRAKFWRSDDAALAVQTGQTRSWTRKIDAGGNPTFIVLVWSDPPSSPVGSSQVSLVNDLLLKVDGGRWRGNFFNENMTGTDDGYSYSWPVGTAANDLINNVEAVFIPPNTYATGTSITISVTGQNVSSTSAQRFALYAYNVRP